jgi:hypothetical protein
MQYSEAGPSIQAAIIGLPKVTASGIILGNNERLHSQKSKICNAKQIFNKKVQPEFIRFFNNLDHFSFGQCIKIGQNLHFFNKSLLKALTITIT